MVVALRQRRDHQYVHVTVRKELSNLQTAHVSVKQVSTEPTKIQNTGMKTLNIQAGEEHMHPIRSTAFSSGSYPLIGVKKTTPTFVANCSFVMTEIYNYGVKFFVTQHVSRNLALV